MNEYIHIPPMPEIEHQPASECMTGSGFGVSLRHGFFDDRFGCLDAPWLLPLGGVVVYEPSSVADCAVEREQ